MTIPPTATPISPARRRLWAPCRDRFRAAAARVISALLTVTAAIAQAAAAPAALSVAAPAASWSVAGRPGAVTSITARLRTGGRIVADRFVTDGARAREERAALVGPVAQRGSCARAASARPFTRLRRYAANGRLLWEWRAGRYDQAVRLSATGTADCLSPDGGRLIVVSYRLAAGEPVTPLGYAIVAVDRRPRFVDAAALGSREADVIGWRRGAPATLLYETADGDGPAMPRQLVVR